MNHHLLSDRPLGHLSAAENNPFYFEPASVTTGIQMGPQQAPIYQHQQPNMAYTCGQANGLTVNERNTSHTLHHQPASQPSTSAFVEPAPLMAHQHHVSQSLLPPHHSRVVHQQQQHHNSQNLGLFEHQGGYHQSHGASNSAGPGTDAYPAGNHYEPEYNLPMFYQSSAPAVNSEYRQFGSAAQQQQQQQQQQQPIPAPQASHFNPNHYLYNNQHQQQQQQQQQRGPSSSHIHNLQEMAQTHQQPAMFHQRRPNQMLVNRHGSSILAGTSLPMGPSHLSSGQQAGNYLQPQYGQRQMTQRPVEKYYSGNQLYGGQPPYRQITGQSFYPAAAPTDLSNTSGAPSAQLGAESAYCQPQQQQQQPQQTYQAPMGHQNHHQIRLQRGTTPIGGAGATAASLANSAPLSRPTSVDCDVRRPVGYVAPGCQDSQTNSASLSNVDRRLSAPPTSAPNLANIQPSSFAHGASQTNTLAPDQRHQPQQQQQQPQDLEASSQQAPIDYGPPIVFEEETTEPAASTAATTVTPAAAPQPQPQQQQQQPQPSATTVSAEPAAVAPPPPPPPSPPPQSQQQPSLDTDNNKDNNAERNQEHNESGAKSCNSNNMEPPVTSPTAAPPAPTQLGPADKTDCNADATGAGSSGGACQPAPSASPQPNPCLPNRGPKPDLEMSTLRVFYGPTNQPRYRREPPYIEPERLALPLRAQQAPDERDPEQVKPQDKRGPSGRQPTSARQDWLETISKYMVDHMNRFGICVIDNFLGPDRGNLIVGEVQRLFSTGNYTEGRLVSDRINSRALGDNGAVIRNDRVIWVDGNEDGCAEINNLIQTLGSVIANSSKLSLYSNNEFDSLIINKRTKAHVTCYPGNGTRYIKHVDNPNGDGRVITAIYYLNKDWDVKRDGGLLRMFPVGINQVANIEPLFDRVLFFWSDRRNPHEVLPAFRDRFAITVWYMGESRA